jgi:hypothetical protein
MKYILFALLFLFPTTLFGQTSISEDEKKEVVESITIQLRKFYLFPDTAKKMGTSISEKLAMGAYRTIGDTQAFADKLTEDLVAVSHDKHIKVFFDPDWVAESRKASPKEEDLELLSRTLPFWRKENFHFKELKVLPGNIGYLDLQGMADTKYAGETAVAAMNYLSNADALIIDLRKNHGGYGNMVNLIASYLFDTEPVLLSELHLREGNTVTQDYTLAYVPGRRRPDVPVYFLTSNFTFSAAEAFCYRLQNLRRATIVGETTGGGAHVIEQKAVSDRYSINIPYGRPIDPITKTNWEGAGVKPDIEVSAVNALTTARIAALEKLSATVKSGNNIFLWHLTALKATQTSVNIDRKTLESYAGNYGAMKLTLEDGGLYFQNGAQAKYKLMPMASDLFMIEELPYVRIKIEVENGKVDSLTRLYEDGTSRRQTKDK